MSELHVIAPTFEARTIYDRLTKLSRSVRPTAGGRAARTSANTACLPKRRQGRAATRQPRASPSRRATAARWISCALAHPERYPPHGRTRRGTDCTRPGRANRSTACRHRCRSPFPSLRSSILVPMVRAGSTRARSSRHRRRAASRRAPPDGTGCSSDPRPARWSLVDRYRPSSEQKRVLRARDMTCRFPGCTTPARRSDIDHSHDYARGGRTSVENLSTSAKRTTRSSTQRGWSPVQLGGGVLEWLSPCRLHLSR